MCFTSDFRVSVSPHLVGFKHGPIFPPSTSGLMGRKRPDFWKKSGCCWAVMIWRKAAGALPETHMGQVTPSAAMGRPPWRRAPPVGDVPLRLSVGTWGSTRKNTSPFVKLEKPTNPKKWNHQKTTNTLNTLMVDDTGCFITKLIDQNCANSASKRVAWAVLV